jgi:hypothetical protein
MLQRHLEPATQEPMIVTPLPQRPPRPTAHTVLTRHHTPLPRHPLQIRRRCRHRAARPLLVRILVREIRGRVQLLRRQLPVQRRVAEMGQVRQLLRRLPLPPRRRFRLAITRRLILRHRASFVEHLRQRQLPHLEATLLPDHPPAFGRETLRLPAPQLVQQLREPGHEPIQTWGCDTYQPDPGVSTKVLRNW